jgi:hypothetical protein
MNNQTERLLTFASEKMVTEEGFYYCFNDTGIEFLPEDTELWLTLTFEGQLKAEYTQFKYTPKEFKANKTFPEDVKVTEILKWLKSKTK